MKASKRASRTLEMLLRFSIFLSTRRAKKISQGELDFLNSVSKKFHKITPRRYNTLFKLHRKYFPKAKAA